MACYEIQVLQNYEKQDGNEKSCRVPLYSLLPLLFLAAYIYMLYSSLVFTGNGALTGVSIPASGVPVWFLAGKIRKY